MAQQLPQACGPQAKCKVPTNRFVFLPHMHEIDKWLRAKVPKPWHPPHPEVSSDLIPVTKPTPADAKSPLWEPTGLALLAPSPGRSRGCKTRVLTELGIPAPGAQKGEGGSEKQAGAMAEGRDRAGDPDSSPSFAMSFS